MKKNISLMLLSGFMLMSSVSLVACSNEPSWSFVQEEKLFVG